MTPIQTGRARSMRIALPLSHGGVGLGTPILTTDGALPVEFLTPGDRIVTHDRGAVALARMVLRRVPAHETVRLSPRALRPDATARPLILSARQKVVLRGWRARVMFGKPAALVEIARLVDGAFVARLSGEAPVHLFQPVFDDGRHGLPLEGTGLLLASEPLPAAAAA